MKRPFLLLLATLLLVSSCKKTETAPTDVTNPDIDSVEVFFGTLSPGGSNIHGFTVLQNTTAKITLGSLILNGTTTTVSSLITIGLGTLNADSTVCNATSTVTVTPALTTQMTQSLVPGGYCVSLTDAGGLPGDTNFAVRLTQTTVFEPQGQAGTETFSSNIYPGTSINRTFAVRDTGSINVTLSSVSPQSSLGLGLGMTSNNSDCFLHRVVISTPGAPATLTATGDPDVYCVRVFDPGTLPDRALFQISITHQ